MIGRAGGREAVPGRMSIMGGPQFNSGQGGGVMRAMPMPQKQGQAMMGDIGRRTSQYGDPFQQAGGPRAQPQTAQKRAVPQQQMQDLLQRRMMGMQGDPRQALMQRMFGGQQADPRAMMMQQFMQSRMGARPMMGHPMQNIMQRMGMYRGR